MNTRSGTSYSSTVGAKYDNNFLRSNCTCYTSSTKYYLWQPNTGQNYDTSKYTDLIKIPCDETYTKADFTFTYGWSWANYAIITSHSTATFMNTDIGTYYTLKSYTNDSNITVYFNIAIKKYDGYYTLSLNAYSTTSDSSVLIYLYPLRSGSFDDKTIFNCTLYN